MEANIELKNLKTIDKSQKKYAHIYTEIDFVPEYSLSKLEEIIKKALTNCMTTTTISNAFSISDALTGILNKKVINLLKDKFSVDYKDATLEQKLMGIPIRINIVNPDAIHLWKEIK